MDPRHGPRPSWEVLHGPVPPSSFRALVVATRGPGGVGVIDGRAEGGRGNWWVTKETHTQRTHKGLPSCSHQ